MALTTVPAAGAKLRASVLSALMAERTPLYAEKTIAEIVNNSNVYQDDNELFVPVEANATYAAHLHLTFTSGTTPDIKFAGTVPTGATAPAWSWLAAGTNADSALTGGLVVAGTAAVEPVDAWGLVIVGSNAGTVQIIWAQATANPSDTTVHLGSFLVLHRVA